MRSKCRRRSVADDVRDIFHAGVALDVNVIAIFDATPARLRAAARAEMSPAVAAEFVAVSVADAPSGARSRGRRQAERRRTPHVDQEFSVE